MVDKQLKQTGAKIIFAEEESMLKQWENMHRPPGPDHVIPPSGPGQAGILAPTHREVDRRCSVISTSQTKPITIFPLHTRQGDMRRPSDIWQGGKQNQSSNRISLSIIVQCPKLEPQD